MNFSNSKLQLILIVQICTILLKLSTNVVECQHHRKVQSKSQSQSLKGSKAKSQSQIGPVLVHQDDDSDSDSESEEYIDNYHYPSTTNKYKKHHVHHHPTTPGYSIFAKSKITRKKTPLEEIDEAASTTTTTKKPQIPTKLYKIIFITPSPSKINQKKMDFDTKLELNLKKRSTTTPKSVKMKERYRTVRKSTSTTTTTPEPEFTTISEFVEIVRQTTNRNFLVNDDDFLQNYDITTETPIFIEHHDHEHTTEGPEIYEFKEEDFEEGNPGLTTTEISRFMENSPISDPDLGDNRDIEKSDDNLDASRTENFEKKDEDLVEENSKFSEISSDVKTEEIQENNENKYSDLDNSGTNLDSKKIEIQENLENREFSENSGTISESKRTEVQEAKSSEISENSKLESKKSEIQENLENKKENTVQSHENFNAKSDVSENSEYKNTDFNTDKKFLENSETSIDAKTAEIEKNLENKNLEAKNIDLETSNKYVENSEIDIEDRNLHSKATEIQENLENKNEFTEDRKFSEISEISDQNFERSKDTSKFSEYSDLNLENQNSNTNSNTNTITNTLTEESGVNENIKNNLEGSEQAKLSEGFNSDQDTEKPIFAGDLLKNSESENQKNSTDNANFESQSSNNSEIFEKSQIQINETISEQKISNENNQNSVNLETEYQLTTTPSSEVPTQDAEKIIDMLEKENLDREREQNFGNLQKKFFSSKSSKNETNIIENRNDISTENKQTSDSKSDSEKFQNDSKISDRQQNINAVSSTDEFSKNESLSKSENFTNAKLVQSVSKDSEINQLTTTEKPEILEKLTQKPDPEINEIIEVITGKSDKSQIENISDTNQVTKFEEISRRNEFNLQKSIQSDAEVNSDYNFKNQTKSEIVDFSTTPNPEITTTKKAKTNKNTSKSNNKSKGNSTRKTTTEISTIQNETQTDSNNSSQINQEMLENFEKSSNISSENLEISENRTELIAKNLEINSNNNSEILNTTTPRIDFESPDADQIVEMFESDKLDKTLPNIFKNKIYEIKNHADSNTNKGKNYNSKKTTGKNSKKSQSTKKAKKTNTLNIEKNDTISRFENQINKTFGNFETTTECLDNLTTKNPKIEENFDITTQNPLYFEHTTIVVTEISKENLENSSKNSEVTKFSETTETIDKNLNNVAEQSNTEISQEGSKNNKYSDFWIDFKRSTTMNPIYINDFENFRFGRVSGEKREYLETNDQNSESGSEKKISDNMQENFKNEKNSDIWSDFTASSTSSPVYPEGNQHSRFKNLRNLDSTNIKSRYSEDENLYSNRNTENSENLEESTTEYKIEELDFSNTVYGEENSYQMNQMTENTNYFGNNEFQDTDAYQRTINKDNVKTMDSKYSENKNIEKPMLEKSAKNLKNDKIETFENKQKSAIELVESKKFNEPIEPQLLTSNANRQRSIDTDNRKTESMDSKYLENKNTEQLISEISSENLKNDRMETIKNKQKSAVELAEGKKINDEPYESQLLTSKKLENDLVTEKPNETVTFMDMWIDMKKSKTISPSYFEDNKNQIRPATKTPKFEETQKSELNFDKSTDEYKDLKKVKTTTIENTEANKTLDFAFNGLNQTLQIITEAPDLKSGILSRDRDYQISFQKERSTNNENLETDSKLASIERKNIKNNSEYLLTTDRPNSDFELKSLKTDSSGEKSNFGSSHEVDLYSLNFDKKLTDEFSFDLNSKNSSTKIPKIKDKSSKNSTRKSVVSKYGTNLNTRKPRRSTTTDKYGLKSSSREEYTSAEVSSSENFKTSAENSKILDELTTTEKIFETTTERIVENLKLSSKNSTRKVIVSKYGSNGITRKPRRSTTTDKYGLKSSSREDTHSQEILSSENFKTSAEKSEILDVSTSTEKIQPFTKIETTTITIGTTKLPVSSKNSTRKSVVSKYGTNLNTRKPRRSTTTDKYGLKSSSREEYTSAELSSSENFKTSAENSKILDVSTSTDNILFETTTVKIVENLKLLGPSKNSTRKVIVSKNRSNGSTRKPRRSTTTDKYGLKSSSREEYTSQEISSTENFTTSAEKSQILEEFTTTDKILETTTMRIVEYLKLPASNKTRKVIVSKYGSNGSTRKPRRSTTTDKYGLKSSSREEYTSAELSSSENFKTSAENSKILDGFTGTEKIQPFTEVETTTIGTNITKNVENLKLPGSSKTRKVIVSKYGSNGSTRKPRRSTTTDKYGLKSNSREEYTSQEISSSENFKTSAENSKILDISTSTENIFETSTIRNFENFDLPTNQQNYHIGSHEILDTKYDSNTIAKSLKNSENLDTSKDRTISLGNYKTNENYENFGKFSTTKPKYYVNWDEIGTTTDKSSRLLGDYRNYEIYKDDKFTSDKYLEKDKDLEKSTKSSLVLSNYRNYDLYLDKDDKLSSNTIKYVDWDEIGTTESNLENFEKSSVESEKFDKYDDFNKDGIWIDFKASTTPNYLEERENSRFDQENLESKIENLNEYDSEDFTKKSQKLDEKLTTETSVLKDLKKFEAIETDNLEEIARKKYRVEKSDEIEVFTTEKFTFFDDIAKEDSKFEKNADKFQTIESSELHEDEKYFKKSLKDKDIYDEKREKFEKFESKFDKSGKFESDNFDEIEGANKYIENGATTEKFQNFDESLYEESVTTTRPYFEDLEEHEVDDNLSKSSTETSTSIYDDKEKISVTVRPLKLELGEYRNVDIYKDDKFTQNTNLEKNKNLEKSTKSTLALSNYRNIDLYNDKFSSNTVKYVDWDEISTTEISHFEAKSAEKFERTQKDFKNLETKKLDESTAKSFLNFESADTDKSTNNLSHENLQIESRKSDQTDKKSGIKKIINETRKSTESSDKSNKEITTHFESSEIQFEDNHDKSAIDNLEKKSDQNLNKPKVLKIINDTRKSTESIDRNVKEISTHFESSEIKIEESPYDKSAISDTFDRKSTKNGDKSRGKLKGFETKKPSDSVQKFYKPKMEKTIINDTRKSIENADNTKSEISTHFESSELIYEDKPYEISKTESSKDFESKSKNLENLETSRKSTENLEKSKLQIKPTQFENKEITFEDSPFSAPNSNNQISDTKKQTKLSDSAPNSENSEKIADKTYLIQNVNTGDSTVLKTSVDQNSQNFKTAISETIEKSENSKISGVEKLNSDLGTVENSEKLENLEKGKLNKKIVEIVDAIDKNTQKPKNATKGAKHKAKIYKVYEIEYYDEELDGPARDKPDLVEVYKVKSKKKPQEKFHKKLKTIKTTTRRPTTSKS